MVIHQRQVRRGDAGARIEGWRVSSAGTRAAGLPVADEVEAELHGRAGGVRRGTGRGLRAAVSRPSPTRLKRLGADETW